MDTLHFRQYDLDMALSTYTDFDRHAGRKTATIRLCLPTVSPSPVSPIPGSPIPISPIPVSPIPVSPIPVSPIPVSPIPDDYK